MRKITLFSSLLCALMFCTTAMAQGISEADALKFMYVSGPVTEISEDDTWYLMEQSRGGISYLYADASDKIKRKASGTTAKTLSGSTVGTNDNKYALVRFKKLSDGTYNIEMGTGKFFKRLQGEQLTCTDQGAEYGVFYINKVTKKDGSVTFQFGTTSQGGTQLDNEGANNNVLGWNEGFKTVVDNEVGNNEWRLYKVALYSTTVECNISIKESGDEAVKHVYENVTCPQGVEVALQDLVPANVILNYEDKKVTPTAGDTEFTLTYTPAVPFAASWDKLVTAGDKWVSFFTQNGRMHVYDNRCIYNDVKKNPTIDKATFASLEDRCFWGFLCDPFTSDVVKIVNKGEGTGKTLYLSEGNDDIPVLFTDIDGNVPDSWKNNRQDEWIIEKGNNYGGIQYFCLKSKYDTRQRINNNALKGFMTTWNDGGTSDNGANIKFTPELDTYQILKGRALDAPANAINSLTSEARKKITDYDNANESPTVDGYKGVVTAINQMEHEGVVPFEDGGYYYLRNYTPDGESETFALASTDGTKANGVVIPSGELGSSSVDMTYSNINAIWKISKADPNDNGYTGGSQDIGVSKSIGRHVTHVNSGKKLTGNISDNSAQLSASASVFYFVNLGAGQHFMKNVKYTGTGEQAKSMPLGVKVNWSSHLPVPNSVNKNTDGTAMLDKRPTGNTHLKNSHDVWYGIPVTSIDVTITDAGYATIYLPFGVTLPEDNTLEAYAVTAAGDGVATLTPVTSIPAKKGVILKGTANQTYTLTINDNASWSITSNLLSGSCMPTKVKDNAYVLSKQGEVVGLYKAEKNQTVDSANDSWLNNANKAYLPADMVNASGESRFLSFNFDTVTGLDVISGTESGSEESVVYDLSGRRVRTAQKGLYIVNGKKVIK